MEELQTEIEQLRAELARARLQLRRAKDPRPVERPSWRRIVQLADDACMNVKRIPGGFLLSLGHLARRFRRLKDIWETLTQEDLIISELFPWGDKPRSPSPAPPLLKPKNPVLAPAATAANNSQKPYDPY